MYTRWGLEMVDRKNPQEQDDPRSLEDEDGVENVESDNEARIEHPFDPEQIKIRTVNISVDYIVGRIQHNEIDLAPPFQRMRDIWKLGPKSRLIESLLLRIPIPVFYVAADEDENWLVVDGLQRFSTVYDYMTGKFLLKDLEYLKRIEGKKFSQLNRPYQRRISETQLVVNVIERGTPEEVMFNVFRRINTGGVPLSPQEIRHALNPGPVRGFLENLANSKEFRNATNHSIKTGRMVDRECILRFLAFHIDRWENYAANDMDGYLGKAMKKINNKSQQDCDVIAADFKRAMRAAEDIFGKRAFRKIYREDDRSRSRAISRVLFGAWSVGLARRSQREIDTLVRNRKRVEKRFMSLIEDDQEFSNAISYSTSNPKRVRKQFQAIDDLIAEFS